MLFRIAGAQLPVTTDINANVENILNAIDFAGDVGADILLTPEGSLSGLSHQFDVDKVALALQSVTQKARELGVGLALGTCFLEPEDGLIHNQIRFYLPDGTYLGFHSQILHCTSRNQPDLAGIDPFSSHPLQIFNFKGIKIGGLLSNDLWANPACTQLPNSYLCRELAQMGVQVIFHGVNCERSSAVTDNIRWNFHEANLKMNASAGKLWIITVDNCYPEEFVCSSPSGTIDPNGEWLCQTEPQGLQYFVSTIELPETEAL